MSCYLCAYERTEEPQIPEPLPGNSPASALDVIATCSQCAVWACSRHGTLYGKFLCAICVHPSATKHVLITGTPPTPDGAAMAAIAHETGGRAPQRVRDRVAAAIDRIQRDHHGGQGPIARVVPAGRDGEDNVVYNLAGVIRRLDVGRAGLVPRVWGRDEFGSLSADAIGAVVRTTFLGAELAESSSAVINTVTGALIGAVRTAHEPAPARPLVVVDPRSELLPPWKVSHPGLLDPVMWMVGTAYELAG